jgi:protein gp37
VRCHEDAIEQPLHWRKPRRIFVNSMSDLFHEDVPDEFIDRVFAAMALASQHTFQILTKRAERMRLWMNRHKQRHPNQVNVVLPDPVRPAPAIVVVERARKWPLPNVWLGVSVENQHFADERIPLLLRTPAAVRFISAEPLLGPINLRGWGNPGWVCGRCHEFQSNDHEACRKCGAENPFNDSIGRLNWVIVGGESGHGARPFDLAWARSMIDQCQAAHVPVFVKQIGSKAYASVSPDWSWNPNSVRDKKGGDPSEWPDDLNVREFPTVRA